MKFQSVIRIATVVVAISLLAIPFRGSDAIAHPAVATLTVSPNKPSYQAGEIVSIRVAISPIADEAAVRYPTVEGGSLDILIASEKGRFKTYLAPGWGTADMLLPMVKTTRAQPYVIETDIFYQVPLTDFDEPRATHHSEGLVLGRPGVYRIKAVLHDQSGDIESAVTSVAILPSKDGGIVAFNNMSVHDVGYLVHTGSIPGIFGRGKVNAGGVSGALTNSLLERLNDFVARYPDSPLANTARTAMGANATVRRNERLRMQRLVSKPDESTANE